MSILLQSASRTRKAGAEAQQIQNKVDARLSLCVSSGSYDQGSLLHAIRQAMEGNHGAQSVDNGSRFPYHSAAVPPSSSGLGRGPFKAEIVGSNPIGGTRACSGFHKIVRRFAENLSENIQKA